MYDEVQIHSMEYSDTGTAKMIHNKNLIIPAGKEVVLESGGSHMMLMVLEETFKLEKLSK